MLTLFVVDTSPSGYPNGIRDVPRSINNLVAEVSATMDSESIVTAILARLGNQRIDRLHLAAHGNAGELFMGMGLNTFSVQPFCRLRGRFATGPFRVGVLIHGCAVASAHAIRESRQADFGITRGNSGVGIGFGTNGLNDRELAISRIRSTRGFTFLRAIAGFVGTRSERRLLRGKMWTWLPPESGGYKAPL